MFLYNPEDADLPNGNYCFPEENSQRNGGGWLEEVLQILSGDAIQGKSQENPEFDLFCSPLPSEHTSNSSQICVLSTINQSHPSPHPPVQNHRVQDPLPQPQKQYSCKCVKSKCVKGYCQCMQAGEICSPERCGCTDCQNITQTTLHDKKRMKIFEGDEKKGCTCKRSQCSKRYCQCRKEGKGCGSQCECVGCQNKEDFLCKQQKIIRKLRQHQHRQ